MRLLLILLIVPLIEIALFVQIGGAIGLFGTLAVVVATAVLGAAMLRIQGLAILFDLKRAASDGGDIAGPILHGVMVFSSGLLLLTPGFFTDVVGFLLLFPECPQCSDPAGARRPSLRRRRRSPGIRAGRTMAA